LVNAPAALKVPAKALTTALARIRPESLKVPVSCLLTVLVKLPEVENIPYKGRA
jgi:hypothetical protein